MQVQMIEEELKAARPGAAAVAPIWPARSYGAPHSFRPGGILQRSDEAAGCASVRQDRQCDIERAAPESHVSKATLARTFQKAAGMTVAN
jgi:hypothetical protein